MSEYDPDDDLPWADPQVRVEYEAALGRFMLAFNQLDNLLGNILETVLVRLGRNDLLQPCVGSANFWLRTLVLDLLKHSSEARGIVSVPIDDIKEISKHRNVLAHGHFEQNPFDGSYLIEGRGQPRDYPAARIDKLTEKALKCWDALRSAEGYYIFCGLPLPPAPSGRDGIPPS